MNRILIVISLAIIGLSSATEILSRKKREICDSSNDFTVHPEDCNKFFRCSNGYLYTLKCPKGTVFDDNLKYCNYPSAFAGKCGLLDKKCDQSVDLTRVPGDCSRFYRCANGRLYTLECPQDTVFDNKHKVCNYPLQVEDECGALSPSCAALDFTVHPEDCNRFYRCANNILYSFVCPPYTVFDSNLKLCNYPMYVKGKCGQYYSRYGYDSFGYVTTTTSFANDEVVATENYNQNKLI